MAGRTSLSSTSTGKERSAMLVSHSAVIKRINRKLVRDGEMLKLTRGERARNEVGERHILDLARNIVVAVHVDLEALGRELGCLEADEQLEQWQRGHGGPSGPSR